MNTQILQLRERASIPNDHTTTNDARPIHTLHTPKMTKARLTMPRKRPTLHIDQKNEQDEEAEWTGNPRENRLFRIRRDEGTKEGEEARNMSAVRCCEVEGTSGRWLCRWGHGMGEAEERVIDVSDERRRRRERREDAENA
jgi:hypothetical protein